MAFFSIIFLFFLTGYESNEINHPEKLLDLAETGLEYNQDLYGLARLRYLINKYPKSEYANEAFKELYHYYKEKDELISAFMVLEEFQTQFFDDSFIASELDNLAWLYFKSDDYEEALKIYHKLLTDYPESEYAKDNEDLVSYVEYITMGSSSIVGNFLWKVRLSLEFSFDEFGIPYEISHEFFFFLLQIFIFLFIMIFSYILFLNKKQSKELTFWSPNDFTFILFIFCVFIFFIVFYFIFHMFLGDNLGDFPKFFSFLSLCFLAFFLFKKGNPDYKDYFRLNFTRMRECLGIFFMGFITLLIFIVILEFSYSKTSAAIVSRDLEGVVRISILFPLTFYDFFSIVLFAPIVEEITNRGLLYESIKKKTNVFYGILFSSLLFAFIHEFNNITFFYFFGMGIILAYLFQKTKSLTLVILVHSFLGILSLLRYLIN
jgi:membrane protease YdiL (CAAX protease family)